MNHIKRSAVIGSGVMGAQIAAQLANCGIPVLLVDLPAKEGKDRNALAAKAIAGLKKLKPSPIYTQASLNLIRPGNVEDHLKEIASADWIIEAIIEQPGPKKDLFKKLESHMGPHSILSTNTSGIPLATLCSDFSASLKKRFLATHFFNPPRYLRLVEIIKGPDTSDETVSLIEKTLKDRLNKVPVPALDVPCFIANRIGVHAMVNTLKITREFGLAIEEVDKLTGSLMGRPKTGTYRLADLVGLDTLVHIINNLSETLPEKEREAFTVDPVLQTLIDRKDLGLKTGAGFYKKEGKTILGLDFDSGDYREGPKVKFDELGAAFKEEDLSKKFSLLFEAQGKGAQAAQAILGETLAYAAEVAPAVSQNLADVDRALELGFGWTWGPFKIVDAVGVSTLQKFLESRGKSLPEWLLRTGSSYDYRDNQVFLKDYSGGNPLPYEPLGFELSTHKHFHKPVFTNTSATLWDIGDEVVLLEFHSKMNSQDLHSLKGILQAVETAEKSYRGLVIGNQAPHFCAGANIGMVLMDALNGEYENVEFAVKQFQEACMGIKYAGVPVVVQPHGMALGGGCEYVLHSNRPVLSPETYMGLVEVGVGLLPAGGGTKELTVRASEEPGIYLKNLLKRFEAIATAKVSTSAKEAFELGYLDARAVIATNESTRLDQAKAEVLALSEAGYRPPEPKTAIPVLGAAATAAFETGIYMMREAGYASEHDAFIARSVGRIMSGGGLSEGAEVTEQYLLELEREEFLRLVSTKKSQQRIEHMLKKGKPLRN